MRTWILTLSLLGLSACMPDDVDGKDTASWEADTDTDTDADTDTDTDSDQDITGSWISEGADLSPLFADFTSITATFNADGSYAVVANYQGTDFDFNGTFTVDTSTSPNTIVLLQERPVATAEGIWEVGTDGVLQYEVTQSDPNTKGYSVPTPEDGFGSTSGPGLKAGDNLQIYRPL